MTIHNSPENILKTLKRWKLEMNNPRNDGWAQQSFKEKLLEVRDFFKPKYLDKSLEELKDSEGLAIYEDELELYETYGGD